MSQRIAAVFIVLAAAASAQVVRMKGTLDRVTLYRGQALVTRTLVIEGETGALEVVVEGLPESVVGSSLYADGEEGVDIRAVRFRAVPVGEEPREAVRELDVKVEDVQRRILAAVKNTELLKARIVSLDALEKFVAPTATVEMSKGVLNAEALERLVTFNFEQRKKVMEEMLALDQLSKELARESEVLMRQRAAITAGSTRTAREAVLFLEKRSPGRVQVRLNYLTGNCGWSPSYNFRAGGEVATVDVEYNAVIQQLSGEEWKNVDLILSTATPALNSAAPALSPFTVALGAAMPVQGQTDYASAAGKLKQIRSQQLAACADNANADTLLRNFASNWALNAAAIQGQTFELLESNEVVTVAALGTVEGPSLSYPLTTKVSLQSRSDQQLVRISKTSLPSRAYHVATPVLTGFVYREAEMVNTGPLDFLGGPMHVYLDGNFVGRSELESVARGQSLVVGFGADAQVRSRREQLDRSEKVQGGNKGTTLKYRLVIENFKDRPVSVRLFDRLPRAERAEDLRVTLGDVPMPLSDDAVYARVEKPKGILRWDVQIPGGASGPKSWLLDYSFAMEHDRNFALAAPADGQSPKGQQEFESLLKERQGR